MARDLYADYTVDFKNLIDSPNRVRRGIKRGVNEVMQEVFDESQELVPVDTGSLKDSGIFISAQDKGNGVEASISYGNALVTYAIDVHEDLQVFHEPPTQAKYLEIPMTNHQPELLKAIRHRIGENL
jgi:hypothetical protein